MTAREMTGIGVSPGVAAAPVARLAPPPALPADTGPERDTAAALAAARAALEAVAADLDARADRADGPAAERPLRPVDDAPRPGARRPDRQGPQRRPVHAARDQRGLRVLPLRPGGRRGLPGRTRRRPRRPPRPHRRGPPRPADAGRARPGRRTCWSPATWPRPTPPRSTRPSWPPSSPKRGGPTSHTAILAKSMGMPAVVACPAAAGLADGTEVLVDGGTGLVVPDPDAGRGPPGPRRRSPPRRGPAPPAADRAAPPTGTPSQLLVNLGSQADLAAAAAVDSEGVGPVPHRVPLPRPRDRAHSGRSRSSPTGRCSPPSPDGRSSCARSTPGPTSRSRSSTTAPSRTRRSACAASAWPAPQPVRPF